jgi:hypothetical protein
MHAHVGQLVNALPASCELVRTPVEEQEGVVWPGVGVALRTTRLTQECWPSRSSSLERALVTLPHLRPCEPLLGCLVCHKRGCGSSSAYEAV